MNPIDRKRMQRKRLKWIKTRYSLPKRRRFCFGMAQAHAVAISMISTVATLKQQKAFTPQDKIKKTMAIADAIIKGNQSLFRVMVQAI